MEKKNNNNSINSNKIKLESITHDNFINATSNKPSFAKKMKKVNPYLKHE